MSNFHHPRALIDINKAGDQQQQATNQLASHIEGLDDQDEDNKKEKKNMSTILLEIEKVSDKTDKLCLLNKSEKC